MNCSLEFQWSVRHVNVYSSGNRVTRDEAATPSESVSVQELFRTTTNHHWTRKWKRGPEMWNSSRAKTAQRKAKKQEKPEIGKAVEQFLTLPDGAMCLAFVISISFSSCGWKCGKTTHLSLWSDILIPKKRSVRFRIRLKFFCGFIPFIPYIHVLNYFVSFLPHVKLLASLASIQNLNLIWINKRIPSKKTKLV